MRQVQFRGIEVYKAVIEDHISTIDEFIEWQKTKKIEPTSMWEIETI